MHDAEPGCELSPLAERSTVADGSDDGRGHDGAYAWYLANARAARIRGRDPFQFIVQVFNLLLNKRALCPFFEGRSTGGHVNDCTKTIDLPGERQAETVLADRGYDSNAIVEHVEAMRAQDVILLKCKRIERYFSTSIASPLAMSVVLGIIWRKYLNDKWRKAAPSTPPLALAP